MRILFISPRQSWPPVTGARLREHHLAKALARCAEVTRVHFSEPDGASPLDGELRSVRVRPPRRYTPAKIARGLFGRWPLPVVNYTSREMRDAVAALAREKFDLVHLESIHMAAYAPLLNGLPVVYDWHNIESELMRRYGASAQSPLHSAYAALTARRLAALEDSLLRRKNVGHIVCSARERDQLRRTSPGARISVIENGVDTRFFEAAETTASAERRRILFVGSMNYRPNIEAAVFFARSVWPRVSSAQPDWRFTIVGSNPAPAVFALQAGKNVEVTGTVPDVRPYYGEALAALAPIRTGGGTRLKILEAMAAGVPVISTALGAEGLAVSPGRDVLIAEEPEEWAARFEKLSGGGETWRSLARAGKELVRSRYDWDVLGEALYETYRGWVSA